MTTPALIQDALKAVDHAHQAVAAASDALSTLSLLLTEMAVADNDAPSTSPETASTLEQLAPDNAHAKYRARLADMTDADFAGLDGARMSVFEPRLGERDSLSEIRTRSLTQRIQALAVRAAAVAAVPEVTPLSARTLYDYPALSGDDGKAIAVGQLKALLDAHPDAMVYVRVCSEDGLAVVEEHPIAVAAATMRFEPSGDPLRPARPYFHRKSHQWIGLAWDAPLCESTTAVCIGASMGSDAHVPTASELAETLSAHTVDHSDMPVEVGVWTAQGPHTGALIDVFLKAYDAGKRAITLVAKDGVFPWPADAVEAANSPETARTIDTAMAVASAMASIPTFTDERIAKCVAALVPASWTLPPMRRTDAGIVPAHEKDNVARDQDLVTTPTQGSVSGGGLGNDDVTVQASIEGLDRALAEQAVTDGIAVRRHEPATPPMRQTHIVSPDDISEFDDMSEFDPKCDMDDDVMDMRLFEIIRRAQQ
ncbi:hypothetical protein pqer_cds_555 [Pandoravirus quercus]|uniref:Uncharacterized protein n=1 Tax=Pandoravirus quercus TaxID=2107709 RepID=A0A2U7U957_9VIRU|nr:hypothetical protein pqer_cds_555 [Pandoravirus quercus]AVK74977.1 hypothetical protein pqer_cds_555 [Pandoravirus quercus]